MCFFAFGDFAVVKPFYEFAVIMMWLTYAADLWFWWAHIDCLRSRTTSSPENSLDWCLICWTDILTVSQLCLIFTICSQMYGAQFYLILHNHTHLLAEASLLRFWRHMHHHCLPSSSSYAYLHQHFFPWESSLFISALWWWQLCAECYLSQ